MQLEHKNQIESDVEVSDMLAMSICMQLSEEFHHMMKRLEIPHRSLTSETYVYYDKHMFPAIVRDRRELNLYNHIISTYVKYIKILEGRKYSGEEEAKS